LENPNPLCGKAASVTEIRKEKMSNEELQECVGKRNNSSNIAHGFIKKNPKRCNNVSKFYYSIFI
jgi:hypothetical protein